MVVRQDSDAINFAKNIKEDIVPVFLVSALEARTLDPLRRFLNTLPYPEVLGQTNDEKALFITHNKYQIDGKLVFTGFLHKGVIRKHQRLFVGPMVDGTFQTVIVTEIRCFKIQVARAVAGQTCSVAVRWKEKGSEPKIDDLAKLKTILIDTEEVPRLRNEFEVDLTLYSTEPEVTITSATEIYVYSETFSQVCTVGRVRGKLDAIPKLSGLRLERTISKSKDKAQEIVLEKKKKRSDSEVLFGSDVFGGGREAFSLALKAGETNRVNLRFKFKPQFVRTGQRVVIYTPRIKAVGVVTNVFD